MFHICLVFSQILNNYCQNLPIEDPQDLIQLVRTEVSFPYQSKFDSCKEYFGNKTLNISKLNGKNVFLNLPKKKTQTRFRDNITKIIIKLAL